MASKPEWYDQQVRRRELQDRDTIKTKTLLQDYKLPLTFLKPILSNSIKNIAESVLSSSQLVVCFFTVSDH